MRKVLLLLGLFALLCTHSYAQKETFRLVTKEGDSIEVKRETDTIHSGKVYIVSGSLGYGAPLGKTANVLTGRLASSWGMDISLPNRHYVLYPSIDYWSFGYNQQQLNDSSPYLVENARASYYNVNLSIGTRRQFQKLNIYATIGPSIGLFSEPRANLAPDNVIRSDFDNRLMAGAKVSAGADYKLKGFFIYTDIGLMHAFSKVQQQPLNILSFYVGLKSDITYVAGRVATVFEKKDK